MLKGIALAAALVVVAVVAAVGGRAWHQFSSPDIQFPSNPQAHFADLSGAGRHEFYKVALEAFGEKPLLGHGAGTYQFSWNQLRTIELPVHDAHSLYLESFAELGVIGGLLVIALIGTLLWCGFRHLARRARTQRDRYAVLLATMLAFAVGAAFDWFWEIPALGAFFFLAAGVVVAARCNQLAADPRRPTSSNADGRRFGLTVTAVASPGSRPSPWSGPCWSNTRSTPARPPPPRRLRQRHDHAETARSIEPWAASPYVQLGLLAERQGNYPVAITHFSHAIEREDRNWQLVLPALAGRARGGRIEAPRWPISKRRGELNPAAQCLRGEWTC